MKIEHYQNRDETEVLNIWLKASEQAHSFAGVGFWCGLVEDMRQVYLPKARTWVCRDGGRVVGFACLVGEGELAALFVAPERQCDRNRYSAAGLGKGTQQGNADGGSL